MPPQCEYVLFATKGRRELNGRRDSNVLRANKTGNNLHPTEKPIDLMEFIINKSTNEGDTVLDPFAGSGTTLVACQMNNRKYIGIELNEKYVGIAQDRLNNLQNKLF